MPDENGSDLAKLLLATAKRKGHSLAQMCGALNIVISTFYRWRDGREPEDWGAVATYVGTDVKDLRIRFIAGTLLELVS